MRQNDILIGLIGGSGTGKSIFCNTAKKLGYNIIDGDIIGHEVLYKGTKCYDLVLKKFGTEILDNDKNINRKILGKMVFSSPELLEELNKIVHPEIEQEIKKRIKGKTIIDAAVLFKTPIFKMCDYKICVNAPKEMRVKRIVMRDGLTEKEAYTRINSQLLDEEYSNLSDITLINDSTPLKFQKKVEECLKKI